MRTLTAIGTAIVVACILAMQFAPPPPAHRVRVVCEGTVCRPVAEFWGGPVDWSTPFGTVGPHQF